MMKTVKFHMNIGLCGCDHDDEREYEINADGSWVDEDEIDADFEDWKNGYLEAYWAEKE